MADEEIERDEELETYAELNERGVQRVPTTEMIGPSGLAIVNVSDVEYYRSRGYKLKSELKDGAKTTGGPVIPGLTADEKRQREAGTVGEEEKLKALAAKGN